MLRFVDGDCVAGNVMPAPEFDGVAAPTLIVDAPCTVLENVAAPVCDILRCTAVALPDKHNAFVPYITVSYAVEPVRSCPATDPSTPQVDTLVVLLPIT